jgi:ketosteroid isomerase-like protein
MPDSTQRVSSTPTTEGTWARRRRAPRSTRLSPTTTTSPVRLTFHTRTRAGAPYDGDYQFVFAVGDGRITEIWKQPDTLYQEQMGVFRRA